MRRSTETHDDFAELFTVVLQAALLKAQPRTEIEMRLFALRFAEHLCYENERLKNRIEKSVLILAGLEKGIQ